MENFKVGDTVQWASSANGYWKEKKGIVESVIPAGGNVVYPHEGKVQFIPFFL